MTLTVLVLELEAKDADPLSDGLIEAGALSVTCEDAIAGTAAEPFRVDELGDLTSWPSLKLTAMCRTQDDPAELLLRACTFANIAVPAHVTHTIPDEDWVAKSRQQFAPIRASDRIWVVPTWHTPPEPSAINLILDPGLAFGTGSHASTRLCLQWLELMIHGGETVLDYGCGSGILAIAALKLGARRAIGVDIDPDALIAARANAARNRVVIEFLDGLPLPSVSFDLVVANILANPLKVLAPLLCARCARGGRLALAGILSSQATEVESCYAPWVDFRERLETEGWVCLSGTRR